MISLVNSLQRIASAKVILFLNKSPKKTEKVFVFYRFATQFACKGNQNNMGKEGESH